MAVLVLLVIPHALGLKLECVQMAARLEVALGVLPFRVSSASYEPADEADPERGCD